MQRIYLYGVPYLIDTDNTIYLWDASGHEQPIPLGSYDPVNATITYTSNPTIDLASKLAEWRESVGPRPRNSPTPIYPTSGAAPKVVGEAAAAESDSDNES
jgi:hypothetical protein